MRLKKNVLKPWESNWLHVLKKRLNLDYLMSLLIWCICSFVGKFCTSTVGTSEFQAFNSCIVWTFLSNLGNHKNYSSVSGLFSETVMTVVIVDVQLRSLERPMDVPDDGLVCDLLWSYPDEVQNWMNFYFGSCWCTPIDIQSSFGSGVQVIYLFPAKLLRRSYD